ncbi:MAG: hypothetical protein GX757_03170 [Clostridiales bacterium]|nr:hypothetical protein [Clostridiales bacterium]
MAITGCCSGSRYGIGEGVDAAGQLVCEGLFDEKKPADLSEEYNSGRLDEMIEKM